MLANIHRFVGKKNDNNIHKRTAINIRKGAAYLNFSFRTCHTFFLYFHLVLCWNVCWPFYFFGGSILTHHSHTKYTHKKTLLIRATPQSNIQMAHEWVRYTRWYCSQWPGKKSIELCVERSSLDGEAMVLLIDSRFQSQWSFDGKAGYSHRGSRLLCALQLDSSPLLWPGSVAPVARNVDWNCFSSRVRGIYRNTSTQNHTQKQRTCHNQPRLLSSH